MGRIERKKKMGRPSKADLTKRNAAQSQKDLRRSHRRRNVKYVFDYDDYIDEDDDDYYELMKKEKKLKQLLQLHQDEDESGSGPGQTLVVEPAPTDDENDDGDDKPLKKRKIDGDDDVDDDENVGNDDEVREQKDEAKGVDSVPGTPSDPPSGFPLPNKKTLELILDKLQKKDIYAVYAEPVDPEELPDYHDVIQHPMDFATVRNKLGNGSYSTLEQFESDVFLICSNAMQYNAPDTIYYKQARSIQELAQRKFQKVRMNIEHSEKDPKSEQKTKFNSLAKKQMKKPMIRTMPESFCSDFSSGATLATAGDLINKSNAAQDGGCERPGSVDGVVEGNFSVIDNNLDKAEDLLPGKCLAPRFGRKASIHDDNRRATYSLLNQSVVRSESIFTTFEGESKQLVPVGLHADHSYARSLARFAATLGTVAWKVASQRIEQALPPGFKFGRGWVGEYEPLPTPVLMLENCTLKGPTFPKLDCTADRRKNDKSFETLAKEDLVNGPILEGKSPRFGPAGTKPPSISSTSPLPAKEQPVSGTSLEEKPSFFCCPGTKALTSVGANYQQKNLQSGNLFELEQKFMKRVELNNPLSANQSSSDYTAERQISNGSELPTSRSMEMVPKNRNFSQSVSFKQPNNNGVTSSGPPNGKAVINGSDSSRMASSSSDSFPGQMARTTTYGQEQGLGNHVQMMRTLGEKAQNQHKSSNHSSVDTLPVVSSAPSMRRDDPGNSTARAWMPIGAGGQKPGAENSSAHKNQMAADSLYNRTRELQPQVLQFRGEFPVSGMHFQPENNSFPLHTLVPQPVRIGNEAQFQSQPMLFPQLMSANLSRFQLQAHWRGPNPQTRPSLKQETLPPDLNIGFQSSGSPVRQSTGIRVDSQQPDLALQL